MRAAAYEHMGTARGGAWKQRGDAWQVTGVKVLVQPVDQQQVLLARSSPSSWLAPTGPGSGGGRQRAAPHRGGPPVAAPRRRGIGCRPRPPRLATGSMPVRFWIARTVARYAGSGPARRLGSRRSAVRPSIPNCLHHSAGLATPGPQPGWARSGSRAVRGAIVIAEGPSRPSAGQLRQLPAAMHPEP